MSDSTPSPREVLQALLPGALRPTVVLLALASAVLAVGVIALSLGLVLSASKRALLGGGGLLVWGHGAAWLVSGELQRLDRALADRAGAAQWAVFLAVWWGPPWLGWIAVGALLADA